MTNTPEQQDQRVAAHRAIVDSVMNKLQSEPYRVNLSVEENSMDTRPESRSSSSSNPTSYNDAAPAAPAAPARNLCGSESETKSEMRVPLKSQRLESLHVLWEEMFSKLVEYKKKHGSCLVPNRYAPDRQLGSWVSTQRRKYKDKSLPIDREERLNALGFVWVTQDPRTTPWMTRYRQLRDFHQKHGHSKVPMNYHNKSLANWVSAQRQERKNNSLSQDRIDLLDEVDFVWDGLRRKHNSLDEDETPASADNDEEQQYGKNE